MYIYNIYIYIYMYIYIYIYLYTYYIYSMVYDIQKTTKKQYHFSTSIFYEKLQLTFECFVCILH